MSNHVQPTEVKSKNEPNLPPVPEPQPQQAHPLPTTPTIQVLVIEPNKLPEMRHLCQSLEAMQEVVGGLIRPFDCGIEGVVGVANDEGIVLELPFNLYHPLNGQPLLGTLFFAGDSEDFHSLSPLQLERVLERYAPKLNFLQIDSIIRSHTEGPLWMEAWD